MAFTTELKVWECLKCLFDIGSPYFMSFNSIQEKKTFLRFAHHLRSIQTAVLIVNNDTSIETTSQQSVCSFRKIICCANCIPYLLKNHHNHHHHWVRTVCITTQYTVAPSIRKNMQINIRKCVINARRKFHLVFKSLRLLCCPRSLASSTLTSSSLSFEIQLAFGYKSRQK